MRQTHLVIALLLAACSAEQDNLANADGNGAPADVAIEGGSEQPAAPPPNEQAPSPPPTNGPPAEEPGGEVTLSAVPARVGNGGTVTLRLINGSNQTVGYNLCTSALETASGAAVQTDRICTMELRTLQPGRSANYSYELPGSLPDGRYRFSTGAERMPTGGRTVVRSNTIEVR